MSVCIYMYINYTLPFSSGIQKQISASSNARKLLVLAFMKVSLVYMKLKRIYEVWDWNFFAIKLFLTTFLILVHTNHFGRGNPLFFQGKP